MLKAWRRPAMVAATWAVRVMSSARAALKSRKVAHLGRSCEARGRENDAMDGCMFWSSEPVVDRRAWRCSCSGRQSRSLIDGPGVLLFWSSEPVVDRWA